MTVQWLYATSASAWVAMVLIAATFAIPYLVRPTKVSALFGLREAWQGSSLRRMRLHVWLGYFIVTLVSFHTAAAMSLGDLSAFDAVGLSLATLAFVSLLIMVALGRRLTQPGGSDRAGYRTWHFWIAIVLVASALGHTLLDSPALRILAR